MIVLDCCAAVEIVRATPRGLRLRELMLEGEPVVSSELFQAEIRSAFQKYVRAGRAPREVAEQCIENAINLVDDFVPIADNAAEAFRDACREGHSIYDMLYLTLARRFAATLMTSDRKLVDLCERMGIDWVVEVEL